MAIGPTATSLTEKCAAEFDGIDALSVEEPFSGGEVSTSLECLVRGRSAVVCCVDARDESFWRTAEAVLDTARGESPLLTWLCTTGTYDGESAVSRFLRLSRHLEASVLVAPAPQDLLATALLPLTGLARPGLTGFDPADLVAICRPPSAGFALFGNAALDADRWSTIAPEALVLSIACSPDCDVLRNINDVCERVSDRYPEAYAMVASFLTDCGSGGTVDLGLLEIYSSAT